MPRRFESDILTEEELCSRIEKYRSILSKEDMKYLYSLLWLDVNAFNREVISNDKFNALSELEGFKDLVFYNLYKTAQEYINPKNYKYIEEDFEKGYRISYGTLLYSDSLFNLKKDGYNNSTVRLCNPEIPTFRDVVESYCNAVDFSKENEKTIKEYKYEDLKQLHDLIVDINLRQKALYNALLHNSGLEMKLEQTQKEQGLQAINEGCTKVLVYTDQRSIIF